MASNPMQRKSRISFILGMIVALLIASAVVALLFMRIKSQNEEIENFKSLMTTVYVLNQDVKSGQVLTPEMFSSVSVSKSSVPSKATTDVVTTLGTYSLSTTTGQNIYYKANGNESYYYIMGENQKECEIYINAGGQEQEATVLTAEDTAYYYAGDNKTEKTDITIAENSVIAKIDLGANTVLTTDYLTRANEKITDELRQTEYNIITLPVDLITGDYVDIRLVLPNGEDLVVVSKKQVTIPVVNSAYSVDTIQMNLTEEEILTLSCAIVENYQMSGSKLYAIKYTDAGIQKQAEATYFPNNDVLDLITKDPNRVQTAINKLSDERRQAIQNAVNNGQEENIKTGIDESITSKQEARQQYLQTIVPEVPIN